MKKVLSLGFVLVVAMGIAIPAAAHNRIASSTTATNLRDADAAHAEGQSLHIFASATIVDEPARVERPTPSIADELAHRFASADVESPRQQRIFERAVNGELASGLRRFTLQRKPSEWSELGRKPWGGEENKAYPFRDPATGLVYARARWYDSETGTFLTPDPAGYSDSSNLYIGFAGDPVNNLDPTGECIGLDTVRCRDYAADAVMQFADPRESWGNVKRSTRFLGLELKGAALAAPRLVKGVYDVATHLPETIEAVGHFASAVANDPVGMLKRGGNAILNADPDAVAELTGETLFFAGLGAAAKTPQVANALRGTAAVVETVDAAADTARATQRARVLENIAKSRAARPTENFLRYVAADAQAAGQYVPDRWTMRTLRRGALVAGGSPMSSFFTDVPTLLRSGLSRTRLWESLQVAPHAVFGPRKAITIYEVLEDLRVPAGVALENTAAGVGGGGQFFLQPWRAQRALRPIGTYKLHAR